MLQPKHYAISVAIAFVVSTPTLAADTVATDTARWAVTATKDAAAALTVQPIGGPVRFKYDPFSSTFAPQGATFQVSVKSDATADLGFKLDAQLGATHSIKNNDTSSKAAATVELSTGAEVLDSTKWVSLVDSNKGTFINGLKDVNGASSNNAVTGGIASFIATLVDFKASDGTQTAKASDLPDGVYTGSVEANFRATWSSN